MGPRRRCCWTTRAAIQSAALKRHRKSRVVFGFAEYTAATGCQPRIVTRLRRLEKRRNEAAVQIQGLHKIQRSKAEVQKRRVDRDERIGVRRMVARQRSDAGLTA